MKECLSGIADRWRQSGNYRHRLIDTLVIGLCAMVSGRNEFEDMEELRNWRKEWVSGIPRTARRRQGESTFKRIF